jgi:hypothetical protein
MKGRKMENNKTSKEREREKAYALQRRKRKRRYAVVDNRT